MTRANIKKTLRLSSEWHGYEILRMLPWCSLPLWKRKVLLLTLVLVTYILRYFSLFHFKVKNIYVREKTSSSVSNCEYFNQGLECQRHYASNTHLRSVLNYRNRAISMSSHTKFASCFRWRIKQRSGKCSTLLPEIFVWDLIELILLCLWE